MGSALNATNGEWTSEHAPRLSPGLTQWLQENALDLDTGAAQAAQVLPRLAEEGLFRLGLQEDFSDFGDAVRSVVAVAEHSLTAAFVLWGQRTFIEYLRNVQNPALRERYLPDLLAGRLAGSTGLSNALKYLGGIEGLQLQARPVQEQWQIDGSLPWVTNLRPDSFLVAVVAGMPNEQVGVWVMEHGDAGLQRSADLDLVGLRGSNTAALSFDAVRVGRDRLMHDNAAEFVRLVRPRFLALQCGMTLGLARRSLLQVLQAPRRQWVQEQPAQRLLTRLEELTQLLIGAASKPGSVPAPDLFRVRIELSALAAEAVALESSVAGGAAYLDGMHPQLLRRYREALFIPLITPSVAQLKAELGPEPA